MPERDLEGLVEIIGQMAQRIARLEAREVNPVGTILINPTPIVPANHLKCDGTEYSITEYDSLFAAIGRRFGGSSTTFKVPDLKGKFPLGDGNGFGVGETGGASEHTLLMNEMPSHNHGGASGATQPWITYPGTGGGTFSRLYGDYAGGGGYNVAYLAPTGGASLGSNAAYADSHTHTISSQGGGVAHNNMPPYLVVDFIIVAR